MRFLACVLLLGCCFFVPPAAHADDLDTYTPFTTGATGQNGLFGIWHKHGHVYIDLRVEQLDKDFLETIVPGNGLGPTRPSSDRAPS